MNHRKNNLSKIFIALSLATFIQSAHADPFKNTDQNWSQAAETVKANLKKLKSQ